MKGLLYKDLVTIFNSYLKNFILVLLLYTAMSALLDNSFLLFAMVFMMGMYTLSSLSFDDYSHWDMYARTLPLPAGQVVAAKYLLGLLLMGAGVVLSMVLTTLSDLVQGSGLATLPGNFFGCLAALAVILLYFAVCYPLSYQYGDATKVRSVVLMVASGVLLGGFAVLKASDFDFSVLDSQLAAVGSRTRIAAILAITLASLAAYLASWAISTTIYRRKEF